MPMLVSCIMPTRGRPELAREAVECFRAQAWPERELIIIDDRDDPSFPGGGPPADCVYQALARRHRIGAKRNIACSMAAGDLICHFDDDDYSAPGRIADQVERLLASGASITGYWVMDFLRLPQNDWWEYRGDPYYALGTSLMYTRGFWRTHRFPADVERGEDNAVVHLAGRQLVTAEAGSLMWARIHPGNTSPKRSDNRYWRRLEGKRAA